MLTLPSEAPLNPGAVTVKLKRGSESMSEVWEERVLNTKMGKPLSFLAAYPTTEPLGKPCEAPLAAIVDSTPYLPMSTKVLDSWGKGKRFAPD